MRPKNPNEMTIDELLAAFVEIGIAQGEAIENFGTAKFNRLFDKEARIVRELRSRPGDQRLALIAFYQHSNLQVRLNAVKTTYALDPERARRELEAIVETRRFPQAGEAGMSLGMLDLGLSQLPNDPWI